MSNFFDESRGRRIKKNLSTLDELHFTVQVVHAIIRDGEKFLLGKRSRSKRDAGGCWASVGGRLEEGESLEAAIIRECAEEIGVAVKPIKLLRKIVERQAVHFWFEVEIISGVPYLANDEHSRLEWFTKSEVELLSPIVSDDLQLILQRAGGN